jgi:hypothetical protein
VARLVPEEHPILPPEGDGHRHADRTPVDEALRDRRLEVRVEAGRAPERPDDLDGGGRRHAFGAGDVLRH